MDATAQTTRILFEQFSPWAINLFYAFGYAAIACFLYGSYVQVRKYRRGQPDASWGQLAARFGDMARTMLTHRTLKRRDHAAGAAHAMIFFSFIALFYPILVHFVYPIHITVLLSVIRYICNMIQITANRKQ